jgi:putative ABC transport system permease protein
VVAASTMIQSVRERTAELAVLKTLGFSGQRVLVLVCAEALWICLSAALLGLGISALTFPIVGEMFGGISLPPSVLLRGLGIATIVALLSAIVPAWRVMRMNIAVALADRQE